MTERGRPSLGSPSRRAREVRPRPLSALSATVGELLQDDPSMMGRLVPERSSYGHTLGARPWGTPEINRRLGKRLKLEGFYD